MAELGEGWAGAEAHALCRPLTVRTYSFKRSPQIVANNNGYGKSTTYTAKRIYAAYHGDSVPKKHGLPS